MLVKPVALFRRPMNSSIRSCGSMSCRVPSGLIAFSMASATACKSLASVTRAVSTRSFSAPLRAAPSILPGNRFCDIRMTRTCSESTAPCATATASNGKTGGFSPPVGRSCGINAFAARTRAFASPGVTFRTWRSSAAVEVQDREVANCWQSISSAIFTWTPKTRRETSSSFCATASKSSPPIRQNSLRLSSPIIIELSRTCAWSTSTKPVVPMS